MIYIYRRRASEGAQQLAEDITLLGVRARRTQGGLLANLQSGDIVIAWGDRFGQVPAGVRTLNNIPAVSKFEEAQRLRTAGVATVEVSRTRPAAQRRAPFASATFQLNANSLNVNTATEVIRSLQNFIANETQRRQEYDAQPAVVSNEWLPRRNNHQGGSDLIIPPVQPDYYSKKENLVAEYRLHMFDGKSIRAGQKRARDRRPDGGPTHPWIRSFDAGWIIAYEGFRSTRPMRELAAAAVSALGLTFGAVDIGQRADGSLIVLEVNRAPGIEGGTAEAYAQKIVAWSRGEG